MPGLRGGISGGMHAELGVYARANSKGLPSLWQRAVRSELLVQHPILPDDIAPDLYSEILKNAPSSPMIPRRKASTQIMKITP